VDEFAGVRATLETDIHLQTSWRAGKWNSRSDASAKSKLGADNIAYIKTVIEKHGWPGKAWLAGTAPRRRLCCSMPPQADPEFHLNARPPDRPTTLRP